MRVCLLLFCYIFSFTVQFHFVMSYYLLLPSLFPAHHSESFLSIVYCNCIICLSFSMIYSQPMKGWVFVCLIDFLDDFSLFFSFTTFTLLMFEHKFSSSFNWKMKEISGKSKFLKHFIKNEYENVTGWYSLHSLTFAGILSYAFYYYYFSTHLFEWRRQYDFRFDPICNQKTSQKNLHLRLRERIQSIQRLVSRRVHVLR